MRPHCPLGPLHRAILGIGLAAVLTSACTTWRVQHQEPATVVGAPAPRWVQVTRTDARKVALYGPTVRGDSLIGHLRGEAGERVALPLTGVQALAVRRFDGPRTLLTATLTAAAIALFLALSFHLEHT